MSERADQDKKNWIERSAAILRAEQTQPMDRHPVYTIAAANRGWPAKTGDTRGV
jgi:hypothetical protein